MGGVRGRVSELAGGVIISKDKPPPASAKALAPLKRGVRDRFWSVAVQAGGDVKTGIYVQDFAGDAGGIVG